MEESGDEAPVLAAGHEPVEPSHEEEEDKFGQVRRRGDPGLDTTDPASTADPATGPKQIFAAGEQATGPKRLGEDDGDATFAPGARVIYKDGSSGVVQKAHHDDPEGGVYYTVDLGPGRVINALHKSLRLKSDRKSLTTRRNHTKIDARARFAKREAKVRAFFLEATGSLRAYEHAGPDEAPTEPSASAYERASGGAQAESAPSRHRGRRGAGSRRRCRRKRRHLPTPRRPLRHMQRRRRRRAPRGAESPPSRRRAKGPYKRARRRRATAASLLRRVLLNCRAQAARSVGRSAPRLFIQESRTSAA